MTAWVLQVLQVPPLKRDGTGATRKGWYGWVRTSREVGLASQLGDWKLAGWPRGGTGRASVGTCGTSPLSPELAVPAITYFAHPWMARPNWA